MKNLSEFNDADLVQELERRAEIRRNRVIAIDSPVGLWKVTTEGDCEGRSTKNLGVHRGHICEIAMALSGATFYSLDFQPVPEPSMPKARDVRATANICVMNIMNVESNTLTDSELKKLQDFFGPGWDVRKGQYFRSVQISPRGK
jgi:hypothetical protein